MNRRDMIRLAMLPTPFEQMPRLSLALGRDGQIPSTRGNSRSKSRKHAIHETQPVVLVVGCQRC
jgi:hypothetical protein